jgi:hypothetical protein
MGTYMRNEIERVLKEEMDKEGWSLEKPGIDYFAHNRKTGEIRGVVVKIRKGRMEEEKFQRNQWLHNITGWIVDVIDVSEKQAKGFLRRYTFAGEAPMGKKRPRLSIDERIDFLTNYKKEVNKMVIPTTEEIREMKSKEDKAFDEIRSILPEVKPLQLSPEEQREYEEFKKKNEERRKQEEKELAERLANQIITDNSPETLKQMLKETLPSEELKRMKEEIKEGS